MEAVKGDGVSYRYDPGERWALEKVAITIKKGEFAAILGCNGCGKSTLVKHLNALVPLQQGKLVVAEINLEEEKKTSGNCAAGAGWYFKIQTISLSLLL